MKRGSRSGVRSKYGVRVDAAGKAARTVDGMLFASLKESRRYAELKLLERAGEIWDLELQPVFVLKAASTSGCVGHAVQALAGTFDGRVGTYRGDFRYHTVNGIVVEDVKGFRTPLYLWKQRHVEIQYGIQIREV